MPKEQPTQPEANGLNGRPLSILARSNGRRAIVVLAGVAIAAGMLVASDWIVADDDNESAAHGPLPVKRTLEPRHVVGHQLCIDCHPAEVRSWRKSKHGGSSFNMLLINPNARKYAANMEVPLESLATNSVCTNCHGTHQQQAGSDGVRALASVSCEACHGAAGGENGWLNAHAAYGSRGTRRTDEQPAHFAARQQKCRKAGQRGHMDLYGLARQCFDCHLIQDERLVSQGGHKSGNPSFEFVEWASGEVRHNTHIDQRRNAEVSSLWTDPLWRKDGRRGTAAERLRVMYVVGQLVDIEVSLRTRAAATTPGFSAGAAGRVAAANGKLAAVNSESLREAKEAVNKVLPKLFLPPADDQRAEFLEAADAVKKVAQAISAADDSSDLAAIDALVPTARKGSVFEP